MSDVVVMFSKFDVLVGRDFALVDGTAAYFDAQQALSIIASCDIFKVNGALLQSVTSYAVELSAT